MLLKEAKEILKKNGYRLVEDTLNINEKSAAEHRQFWIWKLEFKKILKKFYPKQDINSIRNYINIALYIDILRQECIDAYKKGMTPEEYAEQVKKWYTAAWEIEG